MRTSEYYGVQVPELGDRADITVVSNAIVDGENNQSGKVENMKATLNSSTIELTSESRTDKLTKYYNGLSVQFISPVNAQAGTGYKIKVDNLDEQPYNNKVDIKVGDIIHAVYGSTGFVSANTPIPRSSAVDSDSEITVATSKAVKQAYDKSNGKLEKGNVNEKLNSAELIVKAIENNQGLKFDTILNIADAGTKKKDYCYLFEGDIYKCLAENTETTPESTKFEPISNNKLSERVGVLENISLIELQVVTNKRLEIKFEEYSRMTVFIGFGSSDGWSSSWSTCLNIYKNMSNFGVDERIYSTNTGVYSNYDIVVKFNSDRSGIVIETSKSPSFRVYGYKYN